MGGCSEASIASFAIGFPSTNPKTTQTTKFGCINTNFKLGTPISTSKLIVDNFKRMNNESYIMIKKYTTLK
jgi:hypothetical protein